MPLRMATGGVVPAPVLKNEQFMWGKKKKKESLVGEIRVSYQWKIIET